MAKLSTKLKKEKTPKYPTVKALRVWALQFTPEEWEELCEKQEFLDSVLLNLNEASIVAEKTLQREIVR